MPEVKNGKSWASNCATALLSGLVVLAAVPAAASSIYAIDSRGDRLYRLDPATGAATLVAPTSPPIVDPRGSGLAVEWATGRVFVSNLSWQYYLGFEGWLGVLDTATGAVEVFGETLFSTTDPPRGVNGMAFARDGSLYGVAGSIPGIPWGLVKIDTGTGRAGDVVPLTGVTELWGLATDPSGTFFAVDRTSLYRLNTLGQATLIGPHGMALGPDIESSIPLTLDRDGGRLLSIDSDDGRLFELDPTTGAATLIGNTGIQATGLVVLGAIQVPTLGLGSLLVFAGLLGIAGVLRTRWS